MLARSVLLICGLALGPVLAVTGAQATAPSNASAPMQIRYGACPDGYDFNYRVGRCFPNGLRRYYNDGRRYYPRRYGACPDGYNWDGYRCRPWR